MTITELKSLYFEAVRIIRSERRMRAYMFRDNSPMLDAKLREIDRLLVILEQIKDAAKLEVEQGTDTEQGTLLDVPHKYE